MFLLAPLVGVAMASFSVPVVMAHTQTDIEVRVVRPALELPLPWEPSTIDVKISKRLPQEVSKAASELIHEYETTESVESLSPTLSVLQESTVAAEEALDNLSETSSTIILKDVPTKDAKKFKNGTLSEEGLFLLNPDLEVEVIPLSETLKEEEEATESEDTKLPQESLDEGIVIPVAEPAPVEEATTVEQERSETRKQIVIQEEPSIEDEDEVVEQLFSASKSLKEAKTNLSPLDMILLGNEGDLQVLSDEELDILNESKPSDEITTEYLRRATQGNSGLSSYSNGEVDQSILVPLSWNESFLMQKDAAQMFELLNRDFRAESGYDLKITSTYRPLAVQCQVKRESPSMTATPGTSNHGYGLAVDIAAAASPFIDFDSYEYQWMMENGHKYGWLHPWWAGPGGTMLEPWHFEFGTFYPGNEKEFNNEQMPEHRAKWLSFSTSIVDDYDG